MEKMNQAFEKAKILVGMEVEDEHPAEDESSFALIDDFNRNCTLSTQQRRAVGYYEREGFLFKGGRLVPRPEGRFVVESRVELNCDVNAALDSLARGGGVYRIVSVG
ncbi:hypothetical protein U1Q18_052093 [Sarracenia purpurea var. burkii]